MATYRTPGVYVEEVSTLPPSVAEVSTAVPAFLGYTEKGKGVKRISTLLDFVSSFGGPSPSSFSVTTAKTQAGIEEIGTILRTQPEATANYIFYYCISQYFKNGGGSCYIVSVGTYESPIKKTDFESGLTELRKEDEPTLMVMPEATLLEKSECHELYDLALAQCKDLGDRFALLDVRSSDSAIDDFRNGIGINNLLYGAAYYPYLDTTLSYAYAESTVLVSAEPTPNSMESSEDWIFTTSSLIITNNSGNDTAPKFRISKGDEAEVITFEAKNTPQLIINDVNGKTAGQVLQAWENETLENRHGFSLVLAGDKDEVVEATSGRSFISLNRPLDNPDAASARTLESLQSTDTALYNQIQSSLSGQRVTLPPSSAMAGVYAAVDRTRGVWKAPANVSLTGVIAPATKITDEQQAGLNIDPNGGKSINAIRAFSGKGTLVWGARTLAGNDNEWRYVSVRRLFNTIEESTRKATAFAVFEPNNATTWLKVKAMIESYLYGLWQQGALMGSKPESAYFVQVGLGKTMNADDVNAGRMIVEIGVAAVRPAEFIVLRFSHKLVEA